MARGNGARRRRTARRQVVRPGVKKAPAQDPIVAAASGSTSLPLSDRDVAWDAAAAEKTMKTAAQKAAGHFWRDPDKPADQAGAYKLPFASDGTAIWKGVTAGAGAVQGARGGVKIPSGDVAGVKARIGGYYSKAAKKYGDDSIKPPWKASGDASIAFAEERGLDLFLTEAGEFAGVGGDFDPAELARVQARAAAASLAYAELGPDADPAILAVATAMWEEALAPMPACAGCDHAYADHLGQDGPCEIDGCSCTGYETSAESSLRAAAGDVAWGPEEGFVDLLCDVNEGLGGGYGYGAEDASPMEVGRGTVRAVDVALGLDKVLLCSWRDGDDSYWVAPITVGADREPVLSDPEEWVQVEEGWVETNEASAGGIMRLRLREFSFAEDALGIPLPVEHRPGERLPDRRPGPEAVEPQAAGTTVGWTAILAPEGKLTSDRRAFAPGAITWRELPLTLMAMTETSEGGHIGAEVSGRIDRIWRDEAAGLIRAQGVFDTGDYGQEIARLVEELVLRGVSVDLAISKYVTGPRSDWFDDAGNWAPTGETTESPLVELYDDDTIAVVLSAEIGMVTVCPFPAFAEAKIEAGNSLVAGANPAFWTVTQRAGWLTAIAPAAVTASAGPAGEPGTGESSRGPEGALTASAAGLAPDRPPSDWFLDPRLDEPTALTVDDDGRIFGHAAVWGVCHIGLPGACRTAPHSNTDYAYFHLGEVVCEDGARIACGQVTIDAPHADRDLGRADATAHYDHTGTVVAHVVCGEDDHGIWVAGALHPEAAEAKVRLLRGAKLSGDWRAVNGNLELVALLAVNVPGFPVPRARALAASIDGAEPEVLALVAAGIPIFDSDLEQAGLMTEEQREQFRALRAAAEFAELAA